MKAIVKYKIDFDFISFMSTSANEKDMRKIFNSEVKQNPELNNKIVKKRILGLYKEANKFYNDTLTYIQRNELDMFFKNVSVFEHYLTNLAFIDIQLEDQSLEDFKSFIHKIFEIDEKVITSEKLIEAMKDNYDSPNSIENYNKETELILETLKDERMFNSIFKNAIRSLKETFTTEKYVPMKDVIDTKLKEHNKKMKADSIRFILDLTSNVIKEDELQGHKLTPYMTFCTYYKLSLSVEEDKAIVVYHYNLEKMVPESSEQDLIQSLLKFLSDPKRYQMIQMLSKEKWCATELAKKFKITPATMSYHVNKMFALGLISFEQGVKNKMYIQLDKERLKNMLSQVIGDLVDMD